MDLNPNLIQSPLPTKVILLTTEKQVNSARFLLDSVFGRHPSAVRIFRRYHRLYGIHKNPRRDRGGLAAAALVHTGPKAIAKWLREVPTPLDIPTPEAAIQLLTVHPYYRRLRLGLTVCAHLQSLYESILVGSPEDPELRAFYQRAGFSPITTFDQTIVWYWKRPTP